jgi:hypothetical protein
VDCEDEHSPSTLRHSEVASVENPEGPPIPEFCQATEERPKVATAMTGEESRYVLEQDDGRSVSLHKVEEGEGESGSGACESSSLACDAEVLARKTAGPEASPSPVPTLSGSDCPSIFSPSRWTLFGLNECVATSRCDDLLGSARSAFLTDASAQFSSRIDIGSCNCHDVAEVRDVGPSLGEDG